MKGSEFREKLGEKFGCIIWQFYWLDWWFYLYGV